MNIAEVETKVCRKCNEEKFLKHYRFNSLHQVHGKTCINCLRDYGAMFRKGDFQEWEIYVGLIRLYIVGPGPSAMHHCSEPVYRGQIGTPEEWAIANQAIDILKDEYDEDVTADEKVIAAVLDRVKSRN